MAVAMALSGCVSSPPEEQRPEYLTALRIDVSRSYFDVYTPEPKIDLQQTYIYKSYENAGTTPSEEGNVRILIDNGINTETVVLQLDRGERSRIYVTYDRFPESGIITVTAEGKKASIFGGETNEWVRSDSKRKAYDVSSQRTAGFQPLLYPEVGVGWLQGLQRLQCIISSDPVLCPEKYIQGLKVEESYYSSIGGWSLVEWLNLSLQEFGEPGPEDPVLRGWISRYDGSLFGLSVLDPRGRTIFYNAYRVENGTLIPSDTRAVPDLLVFVDAQSLLEIREAVEDALQDGNCTVSEAGDIVRLIQEKTEGSYHGLLLPGLPPF
jgi:hypothetical protein